MEDHHEKRSCTCRRDCSCECHDTVSDKTRITTTVLRGVNNPNTIWVEETSRPFKIKWAFVEDERERTR